MSLRRFYGEGPASEFERFAEDTLQVWRSRRDLNKEEKKALLWSHLGEAVKTELFCHSHDNTKDPEATLDLLRDIYGEKRNCAELMKALHQIRQAPMETVRAYLHRLLTAFRALTNRKGELNSPLTDQVYLRDYFVDNLASSQIRPRQSLR